MEQVLGGEGPALHASQLHPWVWNVARDPWTSGHYLHAVGDAAKRIESQLQNVLDRHDVSGADLFAQAFTGQRQNSMQEGALAFGQGVMRTIRKRWAHDSNTTVTEQEALEYLTCSSVLARWVESGATRAFSIPCGGAGLPLPPLRPARRTR